MPPYFSFYLSIQKILVERSEPFSIRYVQLLANWSSFVVAKRKCQRQHSQRSPKLSRQSVFELCMGERKRHRESRQRQIKNYA